MSQDSVPMTMRYYDPILKIIQDKCSDQRRDLFLLENHYTLKQIQKDDFQLKVLVKLGFFNDNKQTFKHSIINEKEMNQISPSKSTHGKSL